MTKEELTDGKGNSKISCNGCGCLMTLFWIISVCFVVSVINKACEKGSLLKGAVSTTKEYYDVVNSIWNEK